MANPRQRRKTRSSSYKPIKQSNRTNKLLRKQAPIRGPKALQDAWDKTKTIRQNYAALGLVHSLNPHDSGGREFCKQSAETSAGDSHEESGREGIRQGFGRIVRDEAGQVVRVDLGESAEEEVEIEGAKLGRSTSSWVMEKGTEDREARTDVVRALETLGSTQRSKRHSSRAEETYLRKLITAHGTDVNGMARDRLRNVSQFTAGQLRRAVVKAGGFKRLGHTA